METTMTITRWTGPMEKVITPQLADGDAKSRNKHLLEQTVLETQNDAKIPNALVLYVLAGAQRGDIHVVRNVASIGGFLSGADIELNDRKWGTFVRLEEENAVDINPGDVFLAGEVEFTCLTSYPERNKPACAV
ncbi:hypothetical protein KRP22_002415 [Phytophthora ramorum]|nr:hypothetical protein KRP22_6063 [Phytophthora ramorum]